MTRIIRRRVLRVDVRALTVDRAKGRVTVGRAAFPCALGPAGIVVSKREGDGATPRGALAIRRIWRRADRGPRVASGLPQRVERPDDGWCDAAGHRRYNRLVKLPFPASHEVMFRDDQLYDLVGELGWNDRPPRPGRGSAIFLHVARPGFTATAGCIALAAPVLRRLLALIGPKTTLCVAVGPRKLSRLP